MSESQVEDERNYSIKAILKSLNNKPSNIADDKIKNIIASAQTTQDNDHYENNNDCISIE